jgi:hydrogenase expression/formation protein HypE
MNEQQFSCPIPMQKYPHILLAHGGGGKLMHQLIEQMFVSVFGNPERVQHDAATLQLEGKSLAFTTDSYVVNPLFFPGGDIGSLAVYGTVNDLAMAGARPLYLSLGLILEEGLSMETLWQIVQSIKIAAQRTKVEIVTGDTKVVERGKGDGIFINTSGIGEICHNLSISPLAVRSGDLILLNGDIGRHGIAIMATREGLEFETTITSDSAPVADIVLELLAAGIEIHCLRDLTRGGLATCLNEIATAAKINMSIWEREISIAPEVRGACEILGLDPLYIANEGRFIAFIPAAERERALAIVRDYQQKTEGMSNAMIIGEVGRSTSGLVVLESAIASNRIIEMLSTEQLPRIC